MDFWLLYLMTRTEDIGDALVLPSGFGIILGGLGTVFSICMVSEMGEPMAAKIGKIAKRTLLIGSICGILSVLMPTRKDWYVMVGGYYVTHIEGIDKLPANVVGAANEFLERYQDEEKPKASKGEPKAKQGSGA